MVHGYGKVLAKAVQSGKANEAQLNESVRRVLRDKFALGLFDNPYVAEDPIKLDTLATEGKDLSQRLAAESVTLLKNEKGLLPLGRDIKKIAVIGPHADSVAVGFAAYTYPAALQLLGAMLGGGESSMAGVGDSGDSSWLPAEAKAALKNELQDVLKVDLGEYVKRSYPAVSLAEAVRQLLPDAQVTTVAGTGVAPSGRRRSPPRSPRRRRPTWSSYTSAAVLRGPAKTAPRERARTPRTSTCRRSRWS